MIVLGNPHKVTGNIQVAPISHKSPEPSKDIKNFAPSAKLDGNVYVGRPVYIHPNDLLPDYKGRAANKKEVKLLKKGEVVEFSYGASD